MQFVDTKPKIQVVQSIKHAKTTGLSTGQDPRAVRSARLTSMHGAIMLFLYR